MSTIMPEGESLRKAVKWISEEIQDNPDKKIVRVERLLEDGYDVLEVEIPALLTVVKEINEPRLPSLKGKLRAKKQNIPMWTIKDLDLKDEMIGLKGSPTQVVKIFTPPPRQQGVIFDGDPQECVDKIAKQLKEYVL